MKKIIIMLIAVLPLFGAGIEWTGSFDEAVAKANKEQKNIMVYIEADNCPYCDRYKDEVLNTKDVMSSLDKFVPLRLDIGDADVRKHFPKAVVTPTTYFITPDKQPLDEIVGYINQEFFFWRLVAAEDEAKKLATKKK